MSPSGLFSIVEAAPHRCSASLHKLFRSGPDRELKARLDKLREALGEVKVDVETRQFLMDLAFAHGRYCKSCTPLRRVGACGPTCALLRPANNGSILPCMSSQMSIKWMSQTTSIGRCYDKVAGEVLAAGYNVSLPTLEQWEQAVARLQARLA